MKRRGIALPSPPRANPKARKRPRHASPVQRPATTPTAAAPLPAPQLPTPNPTTPRRTRAISPIDVAALGGVSPLSSPPLSPVAGGSKESALRTHSADPFMASQPPVPLSPSRRHQVAPPPNPASALDADTDTYTAGLGDDRAPGIDENALCRADRKPAELSRPALSQSRDRSSGSMLPPSDPRNPSRRLLHVDPGDEIVPTSQEDEIELRIPSTPSQRTKASPSKLWLIGSLPSAPTRFRTSGKSPTDGEIIPSSQACEKELSITSPPQLDRTTLGPGAVRVEDSSKPRSPIQYVSVDALGT